MFSNHTVSSHPLNEEENVSTGESSGTNTAARAGSVGENKNAGVDVVFPSDFYESEKEKQLKRDAVEVGRAKGDASTAKHSDTAPYSISVYFDGKLDINMAFTHTVYGNQEPINFFKDISFTGIYYFGFKCECISC